MSPDPIPCDSCSGEAEYYACGRSHNYFKCDCGSRQQKVMEAYQ